MPADLDVQFWINHAKELNLKRIGQELVGPCPNCGGTDRFAVHTQKKVLNCRQCRNFRDIMIAAGALETKYRFKRPWH